MNKKLFTTKTKPPQMPHHRAGHVRSTPNGNIFVAPTVVNASEEDKKAYNEQLKKQKRSAAAKKAWETIRRKKKEAAERAAKKKGTQYRSIDDEGVYGGS